jgi:hypothetical protein
MILNGLLLSVLSLTVVASDEIDLLSDRFEVLEFVSMEYIKSTFKKDITIVSKFGLSQKSNSDKQYPKSGFVGYIIKQGNEVKVVKLQLFKNSNGWFVAGVLPPSQINEAHPLSLPKTGHKRTDEGAEASMSASLEFEQVAVDNNFILNIRSTSTRCYLSKDALYASCVITYGLQSKNELECFTKSYMMNKNKDG